MNLILRFGLLQCFRVNHWMYLVHFYLPYFPAFRIKAKVF